MNLIVATDENWAIGNNGKLLANIPEDTKFFQDVTMNKVVIMGRKTLESLPMGQPLKARTNIIITRNKDYKVGDGAIVVHSVEEALDLAASYDTDDVYVIGGGDIYEQMLPYCDVAHVTKIDYAYEADTYFPNLDQNEDWMLAAESEECTCFNLEYYFRLYVRKSSITKVRNYLAQYCG